MTQEKVLCVSAEEMLHRFDMSKRMLWKTSEADLNALPVMYKQRCDIENDFTIKQLIAYAVVRNNNKQVLCYQRAGSEKRLAGIWSAAIGGHVNDGDKSTTVFETLKNGLIREFSEEVNVILSSDDIVLEGLINEELSEVGHCHTGVVFSVILNDEELSFNSEISNPQWIDVDKIDFSQFELWSKLAVQLIVPRKIFISFLGTNNYLETIYQFSDGEKSMPVRFIQEALLIKTCGNWSERDKVFIFCTADSERMNWVDSGQDRISSDVEKIGLRHRLKDNFRLYENVEMISIPDGFSENEVWRIFELVYSKIEDGDEIYFDVTHAFRSIPMFSTVLFNYSSFLKGTNLKSIQYGAFEKLGPMFKVKEIDVEKRVAPVLDLTNIIMLQMFTEMVNAFMQYGRVNKLSDALGLYCENNPSLKQMKDGLEKFDNYLLSNDMNGIKTGKWFIAINNARKQVAKSDLPMPIKNMLSKIVEKMNEFVPADDYQNVLAAINWTKRYGMLSNAFTMAEEYVISLLADKYCERNPFMSMETYEGKTLKNKDKRKKFRDFIGSVCGIPKEDAAMRNYKEPLASFPELASEMLLDENIIMVREPYLLLSKFRNSINHGKGTDMTYSEMSRQFDVLFGKCIDVFSAIDCN